MELSVWERPEWRSDVRDELGLIEHFLHREKLVACRALSRSPYYGFRVRCLKTQECQSQADLALLGALWKVT